MGFCREIWGPHVLRNKQCLAVPSRPLRFLGFLGFSGGFKFPFNPLKVKLLVGDLRTAQNGLP